MTFSLQQGGVVMSSQKTLAQSSNIHPLAHILDSSALILSSCASFAVYLSPLQAITTRAREGGAKEHSAKQKWQRETHLVTYVPGLSTLSDFSLIVEQPSPSFLYCPRPPSHHPSSPTSVSLVPALHLLPPSIAFWQYGTHPYFPHAQTISILFVLLYSLTPFLFQPFYKNLQNSINKK